MTIRILSFDFDGSLFNHHYLSSTKKDVIASNKKFLDAIKTKNYLYSKNIILIGSNRQSKRIDDTNATKFDSRCGLFEVGSCFPAIQKIAKYLDAELDTFLLADLYGNLPPGTSFARALKALKNPNTAIEHPEWLFDKTKATVLYAQMQKKANEFPNEEIIFDFYDDRKDIIQSLINFYGCYDYLRPPNVILRLHHYDGAEISTLAEFNSPSKMKHIIDANYMQTVIDMSLLARAGCPNDGAKDPLYVAEIINPDLLKNRIPLKKTAVSSVKSRSTISDEKALLLDSIFSAEIKNDNFTATQNRVDELLPASMHSKSSLLGKIQTARMDAYSFFNYSKPQAEFPGSYTHIWDNPQSGHAKRKIKALLMDYTKEHFIFGSFVGRMVSGHWNRHHVDAVSKIIANISTRNYYESIDDIIDDLKALKPNKGGSLWRRIQFIEKKIEEQEVYHFNVTKWG
jgi:hypothetical protein